MNYSTHKEIRVDRAPWRLDELEVRLAVVTVRDGQRSVAVPEPLTLKTLGEQDFESPPMLRLRIDEAQRLMDELWRAGVRPVEGAGSVGQLGAVQAHLEDMRRLVFDGPQAAAKPRSEPSRSRDCLGSSPVGQPSAGDLAALG
jgi:hypothetical protein